MKIRWQKIAAGIYQSDSGRWRVSKDGNIWWIHDGNTPIVAATYRTDSLREAKQLVDDQIDSEATNA